MTIEVNEKEAESSLLKKIRHYKRIARDIENHLMEYPNDWGRFQSTFNAEVNVIFRDIMNFERENLQSGLEDKTYRLKQLFINKIRPTFTRGHCIDWSLRKPYGYAGDFQIIEDIYQNNPQTFGFDRLFDNYFQMSAISIAVRNRKDDFKRMICDFIRNKHKDEIHIMNLASGPCKEIREMLELPTQEFSRVHFDCYDNDKNGIEFATRYLKKFTNVKFFHENAMRIAFRKDVNQYVNKKYDLIYSTGLFDYFEENLSVRLISNLKKLLKPEGTLLISDVRDKFSNPSVHFMEWVGDWNLVYRNDEDFRKIFILAGYTRRDLEPLYEQQGILQYIKATAK